MFHALFALKVVLVLWSAPPHPPPVLQPTCATLYSCARAAVVPQAEGGLLHAAPELGPDRRDGSRSVRPAAITLAGDGPAGAAQSDRPTVPHRGADDAERRGAHRAELADDNDLDPVAPGLQQLRTPPGERA